MTSTLISEFIPTIFEKVHPSWKNIFLSKRFRPIISDCFSKIGLDLQNKGVTEFDIKKNGLASYIRPEPEDILNAFTYFDANNLRAILIGQDPYPKLNDAMGLSFSVRKGVATPRSLSNIYESWVKQELISAKPKHGYLGSIAEQGVLFLNRYLTRTPNIEIAPSGKVWVNGNGDSKHPFIHKFWNTFTDALVVYLCTEFRTSDVPVSILLWGDIAGKIESLIPADSLSYVHVMKWMHPSPMIMNRIGTSDPKHFNYCDHFVKVNEILTKAGLKKIIWDPNYEVTTNPMDQFLTLRMLGQMNKDSSAELSVDEKKKIMEWLKTRKVYDDNTNTSANKYIRELKEKHKKLKSAKVVKAVEVVEVKESTKSTNSVVELSKPPAELEVAEPPAELEVAEPPVEPEVDRIVVFTDGACPGNGKKETATFRIKAGFSAWFPKDYESYINGIVPESEEVPKALVVYGRLPRRLLAMKPGDRTITYTNSTEDVKCTNQRAELMGAIYAIEEIIRSYKESRIAKPVLMIPDNEYVIWWITELMWKRKKEDSNLKTVNANRDLIVLLYQSLSALSKILPTSSEYESMEEKLIGPDALLKWRRFFATKGEREPPEEDPAWMGLTVIHQRSHVGPPEADTIEWERWHGNSQADRYATEALNLPDAEAGMQVVSKKID
jgi:uracil-DNA glycosylase